MAKLFGPNWRTSLSGLAETICLIVIGLCVLPADVWQNPRVYLPAAGLIIAKTVKDWLTRDKGVTSVEMGLQSEKPKSQASEVVTPKND